MKPDIFGGRARVATLLQQIADATTGNKDGIIGNESLSANVVALKAHSTHPLPFRIAQSLAIGFDKPRGERQVIDFLETFESKWQHPTTLLERPGHVSPADWATFRARKAINCARFERSPASITELMVPARGSVDGIVIAPRDIFVQRYAPAGTPSGTTVVFAPGYGETGRTYVEQAMLATAQGHEVYVLDQPWLGLSQGLRGRVDRAFGVARDIAAVTAKAASDARARDPHARIVIAGTSLGGMGAYAAIRMNELGRVLLDGPALPHDVAAVLQSPYFAVPANLAGMTRAVSAMSWLADLSMPRIVASPVTDDAITAQKLVAHSILERINGRIQALHSPDTDLARLMELELASELERSTATLSRIDVIHAERDPLASYSAAADWVRIMGPRARMRTLDSMNHAMAENPLLQGLVLESVAWVTQPTE